ncbi:MAG: glycosyltransferase family 1 protein [Myxococcota bacterium]
MKRCADGLASCLQQAGLPARSWWPRTVGRNLGLRTSAALSRYAAPLWELPRRCRGNQRVLIPDHGNGMWVNAVEGHRCAVMCHDVIPLHAAAGRLDRRNVSAGALVVFRLAMEGLRRARVVMTPSHATARDLVEHVGLPAQRVHVVPLGVDEAFQPIGERKDLGCPYVVSVGVDLPYKNLDGVVRGFIAAARRRREVPLKLVRLGRPLSSPHRQLIDEAGLASRVVEPTAEHPLDDDELAAWYRGASALLFPSHWEGYGWPPREALACGTPVVLSNRGALAELSGPGVHKVTDPHSDNDIARAIWAACDDGDKGARAETPLRWSGVTPLLMHALSPILEAA